MPCLVPGLSNPIKTCLCKIALLLAHLSADMLSDALAALHVLFEAYWLPLVTSSQMAAEIQSDIEIWTKSPENAYIASIVAS